MMASLRSLSGHRLKGNKIVRLIYLDEAGVSNAKHEPYLVVAGVSIDADTQWARLMRRMNEIVTRFIPEQDREGFIFHATELFSGGTYFDRPRWPREKRWEILQAVASIPAEFNLPIAFGAFERTAAKQVLGKSLEGRGPAFETAVMYTVALSECLSCAEQGNTALALAIAEDNDKTKRFVRASVKALQDRANLSQFQISQFALRRIIDTVHFAGKAESRPLQIADMCAFIIKRAMMQKADIRSFYNQIRRQIVSGASASHLKQLMGGAS
jgi:hypothetical protein